MIDNSGADAGAAMDVERLKLQLAENLPDKRCPGAPGQFVVIERKLMGSVRVDRLAFDTGGLRAMISMTGPHTLSVETSGRNPCKSDDRSFSFWKLAAIAVAWIAAVLQTLAKVREHLKKLLEKKRRGP